MLKKIPVTHRAQVTIHRFQASGPVRNQELNYPKNTTGRHFSNFYFNGKKPNGDPINRRWLVYSEKKDTVFCFCCKLFGSHKLRLASSGFDDWKHLDRALSKGRKSKFPSAFGANYLTLHCLQNKLPRNVKGRNSKFPSAFGAYYLALHCIALSAKGQILCNHFRLYERHQQGLTNDVDTPLCCYQ